MRLGLDQHRNLFFTARRGVGFTLVELLVVIAIVAVLTAIALPGLQAAREAARRVQCRNHLKQISLACLAHLETHGHFPTGGWGYRWIGDPDRGFGLEQPGGWMYNILPFLEQSRIHDRGAGLSVDGKKAAFAQQRTWVVSVFHCPSRRAAKVYPIATPGVENLLHNCDPGTGFATTDYAANAGDHGPHNPQGPPAGPPGDLYAYGRNKAGFWSEAVRTQTGIMFASSLVRRAHIRDGTGSTYLVAEKHLNPTHYETGKDYADNDTCYEGEGWDTTRWTALEFPPVQDSPSPRVDHRVCNFGSAHTGIFHAAFCDGSIRSLNYTIDGETHRRFGNRIDGLPTNVSP